VARRDGGTREAAVTTQREIALLRLVAQRIAGPRLDSAAEAVRWLTAVQAQDLPGALGSVALRVGSGTRKDVEAALDAGEVVRSWPMRGTLHLVAAEDLVWLRGLLTPRVVASLHRRHAELGLEPATFAAAREVAVDALAGGHRLRRAELLAAWEAAGVVTEEQRGYHLLGYLGQVGSLCFGPMRDGEQLIVLVDEWIRNPRRLEREEALGELAVRYFRSHGPATRADFIRWTNLTAADARAGLALARPQLARLEVDGVEYLLDPQTPERLASGRRQTRGVFLLPGFDELVLGYADRSATLPAEFANRIIPGGNGVFRPTVVSGGQIVGTWKHTGRGANRTATATPFETFPDRVAAAIPKVYAALP
jgi:hypothetical protein